MPQQLTPAANSPLPDDTLEVKLAYQTPACNTCDFFWPKNGSPQPYGPYSTFDLSQPFTPAPTPAEGEPVSFSWAQGLTSAPGFPAPEIMDGCRKAPIMTIGINPNLTSFFQGPTGASWCYPGFTASGGFDVAAKYAYYYRYRSIYQEHFGLSFITPYLLEEGHILAEADGKMGPADIPSSNKPPFKMNVEYAGQTTSSVSLNWQAGIAPYVVLLDPGAPFKKGDLLAAKINVPAGHAANIDRQLVTYYNQFVPVINSVSQYLQSKGNSGAALRMGEDVCQLDMVACASPHWNAQFMGGSSNENLVIANCLNKNAWVIKQLLQTKPAVLYIVGEVSFNMFSDYFGNLIDGNVSLANPVDGAFTLLRQTIDPNNPVMLKFNYSNLGTDYSISTRLVISPHFSFYYFFIPQFRLNSANLETLKTSYEACYHYMSTSPDMSMAEKQGDYTPIQVNNNVESTLATLQNQFAAAYNFLSPFYYDVHAMLAFVIEQLCDQNVLSWVPAAGNAPGYLARTTGSCNFCVNSHWQFPLGCPYGKNTEAPPPPGFLELAAAAMAAHGKPAAPMDTSRYEEKLAIGPDGKILI